ncbi:hypothetical protein [Limosilactobacillus vaginalis]|uniref:hypothetical protein n=1 Tax=Limosilactobacillus vaginalis TaxID=1633 RepID=UPI0024B9822E|nr:hypothetical protein [Limosilactobacillus vaginalis]
MKSKKDLFKIGIIQISIFVFMVIYFCKISPLIPYDADDWLFNGTMRLPFPMWGVFNPTRVLPEVLMPLGGYLASLIIFPFTGKYIESITFVDAFIVSIFLVITLYTFYLLLRRGFNYSINTSLASEVFFLLSFFLIFKHVNVPSASAFWTVDLTCIFFYLIPGLLNIGVLLIIAKSEDFNILYKKYDKLKKGFFILVLYFALFSNTQFNIILATFSFSILLKKAFEKEYKGKRIKEIIQTNIIYFSILIVWGVTVIFDLNGGRANGLSTGSSFSKSLLISIHSFISMLKGINKYFLIISVIIVISSIVLSSLSKNYIENNKFLWLNIELIVSSVLSLIYLLLAYAKSIPSYASRIDAMLAVLLLFLLIVGLDTAYLINRFKCIKILIPLGIVLCGFIALNFNCHPIYSLTGGVNPGTAKKVDMYIINQVVEADKEGKSVAVVKVPKNTDSNNWPQAFYLSSGLQNSLYSQGIISRRVPIKIKPDRNINYILSNSLNSENFEPLEK